MAMTREKQSVPDHMVSNRSVQSLYKIAQED